MRKIGVVSSSFFLWPWKGSVWTDLLCLSVVVFVCIRYRYERPKKKEEGIFSFPALPKVFFFLLVIQILSFEGTKRKERFLFLPRPHFSPRLRRSFLALEDF